EPPVPLGITAQTDRRVRDDDFEDAAQRIAAMLRGADLLDHLLAARLIGTPDIRRLGAFIGANRIVHAWRLDRADLCRIAHHPHAEPREERLRDAADGDPNRRLPSTGLLEHVPDIAMAVLDRANEVGMTGPRTGDDLFGRDRPRLGGHHVLPVLPILVRDEEADGVTERLALAHAAGEFNAVFLDPHAAAASVALLAPDQVGIDHLGGQRQARRHAFEHGHQVPAVRLSGIEITKHVDRRQPLTMVGVRKMRSSCFEVVSCLFLNSQPSTGMRSRYGMPLTVLACESTKIPPMTMVSPSRT